MSLRGQADRYAAADGAGIRMAQRGGYPFEVRYSNGSLVRVRAAADVTVDAYIYFTRLFAVRRHRGQRGGLGEQAAVRTAFLQR